MPPRKIHANVGVRSGQYRRGIDALDLEVAAAARQANAGAADTNSLRGAFYCGNGMSAGSPGSFYPFDQQGLGTFDPDAINIPPPPPETPMELRAKELPLRNDTTALKAGLLKKQEPRKTSNDVNETAATVNSASERSVSTARLDPDSAIEAGGDETDIQAQISSLEKTVREKAAQIQKSIDEVENVMRPKEPVIDTALRPNLDTPTSLTDAAEHISETLDIAMFSFSRKLQSTSESSSPDDATTSVPEFLTRESDAELHQITLSAIQAEREATLSSQQDVACRTALSAFGTAGLLNDEASGFAELARVSLHRQSMREIEAQRHRVAARAAEAEVASAEEALLRMSTDKQSGEAGLSPAALGLSAMYDGTGTGLDFSVAPFSGPSAMTGSVDRTDLLFPPTVNPMPISSHPSLFNVPASHMHDSSENGEGVVKARDDMSTGESKKTNHGQPAENIKEDSGFQHGTKSEDSQSNTKVVHSGESKHSSVEKANELFKAASVSSNDGCISGLDAEDILARLGAPSINGAQMVSLIKHDL